MFNERTRWLEDKGTEIATLRVSETALEWQKGAQSAIEKKKCFQLD